MGDSISISIIPGHLGKHAKWIGEFDHNHKRITRVLNCLMAVGYKECARNLEAALQSERLECGKLRVYHWKLAVQKEPGYDLHMPRNKQPRVGAFEAYQSLYPYSRYVDDPDAIVVSSDTGRYGALSNDYIPIEFIEIDNESWPSVKHYFYGAQFRPGSIERKAIQEQDSVEELIQFMNNTDFDDPSQRRKPHFALDDHQLHLIELKALRAKAEQSTEFQRQLLATGDRPIFDATVGDYWGVRKDVDGQGHGQNVNGAMLMQIRDELRLKMKLKDD